ncbi:hypothetical protein DFH09DRAFT_1316634 [Mycena vulgaris]|nr:hypothetical protein DFH09DRAFT_1316634 [Mycena vulgaris]
MAFALIQSAGQSTLGNARYGIDFMAVRQRAECGGSLFTFKDPMLSEDVEPNSAVRTRPGRYLGTVFGQLTNVFKLPADEGVVIRLKCPKAATCCVQMLYLHQLRTMWQILVADLGEKGGVIGKSWFTRGDKLVHKPRKQSFFYVTFLASHFVGMFAKGVDSVVGKISAACGGLISMVVAMDRLDLDEESELKMDYSMSAYQYSVLTNSDVPVQAAGYTRVSGSLPSRDRLAMQRHRAPHPGGIKLLEREEAVINKNAPPQQFPSYEYKADSPIYVAGRVSRVQPRPTRANGDVIHTIFLEDAGRNIFDPVLFNLQCHVLNSILAFEQAEAKLYREAFYVLDKWTTDVPSSPSALRGDDAPNSTNYIVLQHTQLCMENLKLPDRPT